MIEYLVNVALNKFNENQIIEKEDEDIYRYGLQLLVATIVKGGAILGIAFFTGLIIETIIFLTVFGLLRVNAGGVHAEGYFTCFIVTAAFTFGSIYLGHIVNNGFIVFTILYLCGIFVYIYAPVETPNKPLNENEIIIYTKRSRMVFIILLILITLAFFLNPNLIKYCSIAIFAILSETITLTPLVSKIYNSFNKTNLKEVGVNEK